MRGEPEGPTPEQEAAWDYNTLREEADRLREALQTILWNTEEGAIKHRDYDHLAKDIADTARAALKAT